MAGKVYILKKHVPIMVRIFTGGPFTSHYKIGKTSRDTKDRMLDAQTGSSYPLSIHTDYVVNDHHAMESKLHEMFRHRKIQKKGRNEWYYLSAFDLMVIDAYVKGRASVKPPNISWERAAIAIMSIATIITLAYAVWDGYIL